MRRDRAATESDHVAAALARPDFYPDRPESVDVCETHCSWVFLAGDRAYKLKKPVVLAFLDYGTPERRREMCREEIRLNRRLAPDVYLGVRAVAATPSGFELAAEDDPRAVDHVVEMRRYDECATMAARLERGELDGGEARAVGRLLAEFHERARQVDVGVAPASAVERRLGENFHELRAIAEQRAEIERLLALERFAHAFVVAHTGTLNARARSGRTREGHGDLRAEHVLVGNDVQVVDCIEFDTRLRELDVADDLAFLVMDLVAHGGERFAPELVDSYRLAGGDPGDDALIAFYASYRALVRAKVALTRAAQLPSASAAHGHESARARDRVSLAERFAWQARLPLAIVVCGLPASGKTRLAEALASRSGLAHLSSDVTRKRLAGIAPRRHAPDAVYTTGFSALTYAELGRRAAREVAARGGAIIDATFRHRADRGAFDAAFGGAAPLLFVECRCPPAVLARRAAARDREPGSVSDATLSVVARESASWEPLDELAPHAHVTLRSDRPVEDLIADLMSLLDQRIGSVATAAPARAGSAAARETAAHLRGATDARSPAVGEAGDMPNTDYPSIVERSAESAHVWFRDVAAELETEDLHYAARSLRAVLHALRDRLTVEEAAQLASQLPTLIRGIYYEDWRPGAARHLAHDVDEFLEHVASEARMAGETEASLAVAAVARVLHRHVSEGELDDVLGILPAKLRPLFRV